MPRLAVGQALAWRRDIDFRFATLKHRNPRVITRVDDWSILFLQDLLHRGFQPVTVRGYYYVLRVFARWCSATHRSLVRHIRREDVIAYLHYLIDDRGYARHGIRFLRHRLAAFFAFLQSHGLHPRPNPACGIGFYSKHPRAIRQVLTHDDALALVHAPQRALSPTVPHARPPSRLVHLRAARDSAILALMLGSGLRRTEVAELSIEALDLERGLLSVLGKGRPQLLRTDRDVFLHPQAVLHLRNYLTLTGPRTAGPLFLCLDGSPITPEAVGSIPQHYGRLALRRHITAHLLRHTFATHLITRGADPHSAQRLLGHKSVVTTLHYYLHLTPEEVRKEWRAACPVRRMAR